MSDIVSAWVGQTERNIADAFEQARRDGAVLLFDEADSFLRDRRTAARAWEVTEVNEFLQQLESYVGVVACTTNLLRERDQASLRRFTFKIPFLFLAPAQALRMFRATLAGIGVDEGEEPKATRALARMANLTPGDFAAVARRQRTLGEPLTPTGLIERLRQEVAVKEAAPKRVGF